MSSSALRFMPTDLAIPVFGGSALLQVHPTENRIFTVFFPQGHNGLLTAQFPLQLGFLLLVGRIVPKEVQLVPSD